MTAMMHNRDEDQNDVDLDETDGGGNDDGAGAGTDACGGDGADGKVVVGGRGKGGSSNGRGAILQVFMKSSTKRASLRGRAGHVLLTLRLKRVVAL